MPKVMKAITISDDSESNEDQEDDYMPYISRETVDGYLVSSIGHLEEYT